MREPPEEKIELLSVELLDKHRPQVNELKRLARSLHLEFGWHYLLDLTWIINHLGNIAGQKLMDAGAGTGLMQWYLAQRGAQVISVDRLSRANLPLRFRTRFRVKGLRKEDLCPSRQVFRNNFTQNAKLSSKVATQARDVMSLTYVRRGPGQVLIYNQDLKTLRDLQENSLDAVVAVSALEHNSPEDLEQVVKELMRVLKPGGRLVASLTAARDQDWWHMPSSGWCYTEESLRRIFCLPPDVPSNYACFDDLMVALQGCAELRDNLATFYFRSDKNGMPWGIWDPQYIPVGICKIKRISEQR